MESDLDLLAQELTGEKQNWFDIGKELGLNWSLYDIRENKFEPNVCLRKMLQKQLEIYTTTTWRNIVDALRSPDVGDPQLADELEAKYCPSEFINNNILLYFREYNVVQHCTRSTPHKV